MINQNEEYVKKRWLEWWNCENHDRPLVSVFAPKKDVKPFREKHAGTLKEQWEDMEFVLKREIHSFENTWFGGEAFPVVNPNLGPDIYGAILGDCDIEYGETTSWSKHKVTDFSEAAAYRFDAGNRWMKKVCEMTEYAAREARGRYLVGITDIHSGMDALTSLRGPEDLCIDLYDCRDVILKKLKESAAVYDEVMNRLFALTETCQQGSTNWMQIWHPQKRWYVTSCDFSCLISRGDFDELVTDTLLHELDYLEASIYHLDGVNALHHLDRLLELDKLNGIQWVYGAGQPTARAWKDVLQKIQCAGKNIQVNIVPQDIKEVSEFLRPEGVHFMCWVSSEDEAKEVIRETERCFKR